MKHNKPLLYYLQFCHQVSEFKSLNSLEIANLFIKPHMLPENISFKLKIFQIKTKKIKTVTLFTKDRVCESLLSY